SGYKVSGKCVLRWVGVRVMAILFEVTAAAQAEDPLEIKIGYLRRPQQQETISLVQMPSPDNGLAGAQMAVTDNNTTGRFLNQRYLLIDVHLKTGVSLSAAVHQLSKNDDYVHLHNIMV